jgi:hypothetical protein
MKTAEEWAAQIGAKIAKQDNYPLMPSEYAVIIKRIQLDARISALEEAAEVLKQTEVEGGSHWCVREEAVKAILSLATKLKEETK